MEFGDGLTLYLAFQGIGRSSALILKANAVRDHNTSSCSKYPVIYYTLYEEAMPVSSMHNKGKMVNYEAFFVSIDGDLSKTSLIDLQSKIILSFELQNVSATKVALTSN